MTDHTGLIVKPHAQLLRLGHGHGGWLCGHAVRRMTVENNKQNDGRAAVHSGGLPEMLLVASVRRAISRGKWGRPRIVPASTRRKLRSTRTAPIETARCRVGSCRWWRGRQGFR